MSSTSKRTLDAQVPNSATQSSLPTPGKRAKVTAPVFSDGTAAIQGDGLDDLEYDLEGAGGSKRQGVNIDGYDSDSSAGSDGGFGAGGGRKGKVGTTTAAEQVQDEDDEDDIFGEAKETQLQEESKSKVPAKQFLDLGDIEGQEFGQDEEEEGNEQASRKSKAKQVAEEEDMEDYMAEDDLANDDDAPRSKRSKQSMGYTLSSFNMADELSEGRFSTDGSYIANSNDPLATHDSWLQGVSKSSIRAAKESKLRMEQEQKAREERVIKGDEGMARERDDCLIGLLKIVKPGETVMKALARLGTEKRKQVALKPKLKRPPAPRKDTFEGAEDSAMDLGGGGDTRGTEATLANPLTLKIEELTHLASTLLSAHGELEIYDQTHEAIIATLKKEGAVRRDWIPTVIEDEESPAGEVTAEVEEDNAMSDIVQPVRSLISRPLISRPTPPTPSTAALAPPSLNFDSTTRQFLYKWLNPTPTQAQQEYGPYGLVEMSSWISAGYFGNEGERILVRLVGGEYVTWNQISAIVL